MAKYSVTYNCGHKDIVQIYGPSKDRDRKADWYRTKLCPDCYKAEQAAKAEETSKEYGLVELDGTEKQVAWAKKIRASFIEETLPRIPDGELGKTAQECLVASINEMANSKWWIDNRNDINGALNDTYIAKLAEAGIA